MGQNTRVAMESKCLQSERRLATLGGDSFRVATLFVQMWRLLPLIPAFAVAAFGRLKTLFKNP